MNLKEAIREHHNDEFRTGLDSVGDDPFAYDDLAPARPAVAAMKAIRQCDRTEHVVAYLLVSVANVLRSSGWSHTQEAEHAIQSLDDLHDLLTKE